MIDFPAGLRVLAVDDEEFNLDILYELMTDAGCQVVLATNGEEALDILREEAPFDVIVLDRMMPRMDGMTFLRHIKAEPRFASVPVIMQTAAASREQIAQGIEAGVYYYLTKPYAEEILLSLVRAAAMDGRLRASLSDEVSRHRRVLGLARSLHFRFRTLEDARAVAVYVAECFPDPQRVVYGLSELAINAVEHGNLGISYTEKTRLVLSGAWAAEIDRRLALPEQSERFADIRLDAGDGHMTVSISDQGNGFDFSEYLELSPDRATDPHGRGIATSRLLSFDSLEYAEGGRRVTCTVATAMPQNPNTVICGDDSFGNAA